MFFDSFGITRSKNVVVKDDKNIIKKELKGIEKMNREDQKLTLQKLKFSMQGYKKLTNYEMLSLSATARDFFFTCWKASVKTETKNFVNVWLLEQLIQKIAALTCGHVQLYFYENLFFPDTNSYLHWYKTLSNLTIETLLNKLFTLDQDKNEQIRKSKTNKNDMTFIDCPVSITNL